MDLMCTIGVRVKTFDDYKIFATNGMTIARFNFSHADYTKNEMLIKESKEKLPHIAIFQDLQGFKIRVSDKLISTEKIERGEKVIFCSEEYYKNNSEGVHLRIPITYSDFSAFDTCTNISMKDGTMLFDILEKKEDYIITETKIGGIVRKEKGINFVGMSRKDSGLTDKDKKDVIWGVMRNVDIICLSYTTKADDIIQLKNLIKDIKKELKKDKITINIPKIWAKIECREGIEKFEEILKVSDGILIGRGDLSVEIPLEDLPMEQDKLLKKMKNNKKPLIIGTYVLDSMRYKNTATIPEINDIYHFINNKVNGFMLSGEVSTSPNAFYNVQYMHNLILKYNPKKD